MAEVIVILDKEEQEEMKNTLQVLDGLRVQEKEDLKSFLKGVAFACEG